jgi:hypothetical protein
MLESRCLLSLTAISDEVRPPPSTPSASFDMAVADNGSFIELSVSSSNTPALTAVRYSPAGEQLGNVINLDTAGANAIAIASIDIDPDGDAVVAYLLDTTHLYAIRISKDGVVSPRQLIDQGSPDEDSFSVPSVSMDASGGFFVSWISYLSTGHNDTVRVRAFDAAGNPRSAEFAVGPDSDLDFFNSVDIAAKADGSGAVIAFNRFGEGAESIDYGLVSTTALIGELNHNGGRFIGGPELALYGDGSFVMAFTRGQGGPFSEEPTEFEPYARRFDAQAAALGAEIQLAASLPGTGSNRHIQYASIDTMPDGGFVSSFIQSINNTNIVYARRFSAAGVSDASGPVEMSTGPARNTAVGHRRPGSGRSGLARGNFPRPRSRRSPLPPDHHRRVDVRFWKRRAFCPRPRHRRLHPRRPRRRKDRRLPRPDLPDF